MFFGPGGTGKSHLTLAIGSAPPSEATKCCIAKRACCLVNWLTQLPGGTRKKCMESLATVPLLIIDDFGMHKLPHTAAQDLLEIIVRHRERFSTRLTSNRPIEDWVNY